MLIKAALIAIVELVGLGLLAFGVFLLVFGLRTIFVDVRTWVTAWRSRRWSETRGTILRSVITRHRTGRLVSFGARIRFWYEVGGRRHESMRHQFGSSLAPGGGGLDELRRLVAQLRRGTEVTVYFDPDRAESAVLDRRPPGLGGPVFLSTVALFGAVLFAALGVHVARGPLEDPPPFTDDELPSLTEQVGGFLLLAAGVALCAALVCALRARRQQDVLRRLVAATPTRVADVLRDRVLAVFGRVEASDAGTTTAPVTGEAVVYFRAKVSDRGEVSSDTASHGEFYVADESGRILVSTEGGTDHLPVTVLPSDAAAVDFADASLEDTPVAVPEDVVLTRTCLAPGDAVLVVGRARRRDGELWLTATAADPLSLIFAGEPLQALVRRLSGSARLSRAFVGFALLGMLVGGVCLAFGG